MHHKEVRVDLRIARKKNGLLQRDVAELLGITQPRVSRLEHGRSVLSVKEACGLLVIYNVTISEMFPDLSNVIVKDIIDRITSFSGAIDESCEQPERRQLFLNDLHQRLEGTLNKSPDEN